MTKGDGEREAITVIVVSYNHERFIAQCLESVLGQSAPVAKILVFDDCSQDSSAAIAADYARKYPDLISATAHARNVGLTATLNEALALVRAPWYAYISADDWMQPERFSKQLARLREAGPECALIYSDALVVDANDVVSEQLFSDIYPWPTPFDGHIYSQALRNAWIPACSVLLRTDAVREVGGYDEELFYEDHDLWVRMARRFLIACVQQPLVAFRVLDSSLGSTHFAATDLRFLEARRIELRKHLDAPDGDGVWAQSMLWHLSLRAWKAGASGASVRSDLGASYRSIPGLRRFAVLIAAAIGLRGRWAAKLLP